METQESWVERFQSAIRIQHIQWTILQDDQTYSFELIAPLKTNMHDFKKTSYVVFVAIVNQDSELPRLHKDDMILLQLPVKCFEKALWEIPLGDKYCLNNLGIDNLFIEFRRDNYQKMTLTKIERRQIQNEHKQYADKYYSEEYY